MSTTEVDTLRVSGARLHYQVRGDGPILLMMSGGHGDADSFNGMVESLAEQYTVVTYDRRGYARSPLDDPTEDQQVATHADDAASLLATVGHEAAYVFGNSAGALIGLDLVTRHAHLCPRLLLTNRRRCNCCPQLNDRSHPRISSRRCVATARSLRWKNSEPSLARLTTTTNLTSTSHNSAVHALPPTHGSSSATR